MPLRLPSDEDLLASKRRAARAARAEEKRLESRRRMVRVGLVGGFAAVLLVALFVDMRHLTTRMDRFGRTGKEARRGDAADIAAGIDGGDARYADPSGLFSLVPPRGWVRVKKPVRGMFNAYFRGPYGMDLGIQAVENRGATFDSLVSRLKLVERNLAADTHMEIAYVGPHRAVRRTAQLFKNKVLTLDFLTGDLAHHIQFAAPPELFDEYEPVILRLLETYEPGTLLPPAPAPAPEEPPTPSPLDT
jgi:hypothetical protein